MTDILYDRCPVCGERRPTVGVGMLPEYCGECAVKEALAIAESYALACERQGYEITRMEVK